MNQTLDEYQFVRPLGQGAMGEVWLARDTLLDRDVALKLILAAQPSAEATGRFLAEARAVARLTDPNVVTVFRVGESGGRHFLVSEYIRGKTLAEIPRPVPYEQLVDVAIDLARGLAAAHRAGVLHRDIKSDNALISEDGTVKLVDFGLAKVLHADAPRAPATAPHPRAPGSANVAETAPLASPARRGDTAPLAGSEEPQMRAEEESGPPPSPALTQAGAIIGTPRYMAPECLRGEPATKASDVYSLGVVLFELATGTVPYPQRNLAELRDAALVGERAALVIPGAPSAEFAQRIERALHPSPGQRFACGEEFCEALLATVRPAKPAPSGPAGANPYRGLSSYGEGDEALFYGRSRESAAVCRLLRSEALVVVTGESGVGKSSLCHAGVVPLVRRDGLGDGRTWATLRFRPGKMPVSALAEALSTLGERAASELRTELIEEPALVGRLLRKLLSPQRGLLLVVDQLEELCTQSDAEEAQAFGRLLARLSSQVPGVRVLATVRGDLLTRVAEAAGLASSIARSLYLLEPLQGSALRDAIREPALWHGISFESEELVEELAGQVESSRGALPLLQMLLAELWSRRDANDSCIRAASLEKLGGLRSVLETYANNVMAAMRPGEQRVARRQLMSLVSASGTTALRSRGVLEAMAPEGARALQALVHARLVVVTSGGERAESECRLAHDALIAQWSELQAWLAEHKRERELLEMIERRSEEWNTIGESRDALLGKAQLRELAGDSELTDSLTLLAQRFVRASRRSIRVRRLLASALALSIPALAIGVFLIGRGRSQAERRASVAERLGNAEAELASGMRAHQASAPVRSLVYPLFDAMSDEPSRRLAEGLWQQARNLSEVARNHYEQATLEVESALLIDGKSGAARSLYASVLLQKALLAEHDHRERDQERLLRRLAVYDEDGTQMARWNADGELTIRCDLPSANVAIYRYEPDASGALSLSPVGAPSQAPHTLRLPPGSYLAEVRAQGRHTSRLPIALARGESLSLTADLPASSAVPPGFAYIHGGRFLYGSGAPEAERSSIYAAPIHTRYAAGFYMATYETTNREWLRYLESTSSKAAVRSDFWGHTVELSPDAAGRWRYSISSEDLQYEAREGQRLTYSERSEARSQNWEQFPVLGVSAEDIEGYLAWLRKTPKFESARLCTEHEFERAARGADVRQYPHGDTQKSSDTNHENTYHRVKGTMGPDEVGSHPRSVSPFGVHDLVGNASEFYDFDETYVAIRGGGWASPARMGTTNRTVAPRSHRAAETGFRVCLDR